MIESGLPTALSVGCLQEREFDLLLKPLSACSIMIRFRYARVTEYESMEVPQPLLAAWRAAALRTAALQVFEPIDLRSMILPGHRLSWQNHCCLQSLGSVPERVTAGYECSDSSPGLALTLPSDWVAPHETVRR